jgi:hypothetical protein
MMTRRDAVVAAIAQLGHKVSRPALADLASRLYNNAQGSISLQVAGMYRTEWMEENGIVWDGRTHKDVPRRCMFKDDANAALMRAVLSIAPTIQQRRGLADMASKFTSIDQLRNTLVEVEDFAKLFKAAA